MSCLSTLSFDLTKTEKVNVHRKITNYLQENKLGTYTNKTINYNELINNLDELNKEFISLLNFFECKVLKEFFSVNYLLNYREFVFSDNFDESIYTKDFILYENISKESQNYPSDAKIEHFIFTEKLIKSLKKNFINSSNIKDSSGLSYFMLTCIGDPIPKDLSEIEWLEVHLKVFAHVHYKVTKSMQSNEHEKTRTITNLNAQIADLKKNLSSYKTEAKLIKKNNQNTDKITELNATLTNHLNDLTNKYNRLQEDYIALQGSQDSLLQKNKQLELDNENLIRSNNELKRQLNKSTEIISEKKLKIEELLASKEISTQAAPALENACGTTIAETSDEDTNPPEELACSISGNTPSSNNNLFEKFISHSLEFLIAEQKSLPSNILNMLNTSATPNTTNNVGAENNNTEHTQIPFANLSIKGTTSNNGNPLYNKIGPVKQEDSYVSIFNQKVKNIPPYIYIENNQLVQVDENYNYIQSFPCFETNIYNSLTRYAYYKSGKFYTSANKEITPSNLPETTWLDGQVIVIDAREKYIRFVTRQAFNFENMITSALNNNFQVFVSKVNKESQALEYFDIQSDEKYDSELINEFSYNPEHESIVIAKGNKIKKIITSPFSYRNTSYYKNYSFATVFEAAFDKFYAEKQNGEIVEVNFNFHQELNARTLINVGDVIKLDEKNNFIGKENTDSGFSKDIKKKLKKHPKQSASFNSFNYPEIQQKVLIIGNVKFQHNYSNALRIHGLETTVINGYDSFFNIKKQCEKNDIIIIDPSFISHNNMFELKDAYKNTDKTLFFTEGNGPSFICNLLKEKSII